ncbi:uL22 family ribosomal protein [Patescibacteria group bacterium]|nr:uL22 family ribosomal protein [Patescibacteria group bacterium]
MDTEYALSTIKNVKGSPYKTRLVVKALKGLSVDDAITTLQFVNYKNAYTLMKVIKNAVNIAKQKNLKEPYQFAEIRIDKGRTLKRLRYGSKGNASVLSKRSLNILVKIKSG